MSDLGKTKAGELELDFDYADAEAYASTVGQLVSSGTPSRPGR